MSVIYYRPQVLETIARQTLCKYDCGYLNQEPAAVPIEMIIENTFQLTIEYQYLTNNARELGRMIYDSGITTYYDQDLGDYALMRVQAGTMCFLASNFPHFHRYDSLKSALYIHAVSKNINTFPKNQGRIRAAIAVKILDFTVMYR